MELRPIMSIILSVPIVFFIPVLISAFLTFDSIVRLEYKSYRTNWEDDSRPHGFFGLPVEVKTGWGVLTRVLTAWIAGRT